MEKVPEGSTVVIESSTTGKAISRLLSGRYEVHMISPPERKPAIKTDKRDAERIVKEDMLGYVRRSYIPSQQIEELRLIVSKQMEIGGKISAVKNQVHALLERNLFQSEFEDLSDIFGVEGLERLSSVGASHAREADPRNVPRGAAALHVPAQADRDGHREDRGSRQRLPEPDEPSRHSVLRRRGDQGQSGRRLPVPDQEALLLLCRRGAEGGQQRGARIASTAA